MREDQNEAPSWAELFAADAAPLPKSKQASSLQDVAAALGVSAAKVTEWLDAGCPGTCGFDLDAIAKWRFERACDASRDAKRKEIESGPRFVRTTAHVADAFGVSKTAVSKWLKAGAPGCTNSGHDLHALAEWYFARLEPDPTDFDFIRPETGANRVERAEDVAAAFQVHEQTVRKWLRARAPGDPGYDLAAVRAWAISNRPLDFLDRRRRPVVRDILNVAEKILRRAPDLDDLDTDFVAIIVRRMLRDGRERRYVKRRIEAMRALSGYASRRFNRPPVDFQEVPLARLFEIEGAEVPETSRGTLETLPAATTPPDDLGPALPLKQLAVIYHRERLIGSKETTRLINCAIRAFGRYLGRDAVLGDLNQDRVLDYLNYLLEGDRMAPASIQTHRERLLALWRFAAKKRWLPDFPEVPSVRIPKRVPDAWTRDDMQRLMDAAGQLDGRLGNVPASLWWQTIFNVVFDTAERIGAVLKLRFDHVSHDGWVTFAAETRKGKTRDKRLRLRPETLDGIRAIREQAEPEETLVFAWPLSPTYIYRIYGRLLDAAGLPNNRRTKFHKIRRTTASEFEAAGGNATELLDHSSRSTTKRYLDPAVLREQQPADIVPALNEKKPNQTPTDIAAELRGLLEKLDRAS
jgi:integrase/transcriptional regulator with XRE-family HTH domain